MANRITTSKPGITAACLKYLRQNFGSFVEPTAGERVPVALMHGAPKVRSVVRRGAGSSGLLSQRLVTLSADTSLSECRAAAKCSMPKERQSSTRARTEAVGLSLLDEAGTTRPPISRGEGRKFAEIGRDIDAPSSGQHHITRGPRAPARPSTTANWKSLRAGFSWSARKCMTRSL